MKLLLIALLSLFVATASAGEADVVDVKAKQKNNGSYSFKVSVQHEDEGWDHYANRWEVLSEDGTIIATRVLHHPHVNEQPFTRSMSGIEIPEDLKFVLVRAHDSQHEYGGKVFKVELLKDN